MNQHCPFCETGTTEVVSYTSTEKFGRKTVNVEGLLKLVCNHCHSETVSGDLHDHNLALFIAAEEATQGGVSPGLLRTLRENWDLTQSEASKLFGAGPSSFAKWESSQTKLSTPAALLIQLASRFPEVVPYLAQLADMRLKLRTEKHEPINSATSHQPNYETVRLTIDVQNNWIRSNTKLTSQLPLTTSINQSNWGTADFSRASNNEQYSLDPVAA
jgi:putative zinc finger/helix-turn-helix YgiT family protein